MLLGFNRQAEVPLPEWSQRLRNYYWFIRVEERDKAKRRRYYRLIEKEKLRLVEEYLLDQEILEAVCRYLAGFNRRSGDKVAHLLLEINPQLKLDFRNHCELKTK